MKKKRTITVETDRLLVIHRSGHRFHEWCAACRTSVEFVDVEQAAAVSGATQRKIFYLAEVGLIHLRETAEGRALFCLNSLQNMNV